MEKAGLILPKEGGGYYDRFRNRIIFPIFDIRNRVIGFGARVMDKTLPKYINSPETQVYVKGKNLFGLNLSKDYIRDNDFVVIVEGYLDFIIPYQEGLCNTVASQGTALTLDQIRLLKRYTRNVVMVYDGDSAGEIATLRSLDMLVEEGMQVKISPLPKGMDPDELVRREGISVFKNKVQNAKNLFDYKLEVLKARHNIREAHGKSKIVSEMLSTINRFDNAILRGEYIRRLSEEIRLPEHYIIEEISKLKPRSPEISLETPQGKRKISGINPAEKLLIKFMLEERDLIDKIMQELSPADFSDMRTAKVVSVMHDLFSQGKSIEPKILMNYFNEDEASQLVCESMFMPEFDGKDRERAVNDCISRIKVQRLKSQREHLHMQIKSAQSCGDEQRLNNLMKEFYNLIKKGD
jgi:DNA primase